MTSSSPPPLVSTDEIIGLANHQLKKAASDYGRSRRLQLAALVLGVSSIFIKNAYTYIPALSALCIQLASLTIRYRAARCHGTGEEGRTWGFLIDALGPQAERIDLASWFDRASLKPGELPEPVLPNYFASKSPVGLRRLCDNLQENAFWGVHQYRAAAAYYGMRLKVLTALAAILVLASVPYTSGGQGLILARILVAVLASGAALTQLTEVMSWRSAEVKSETLDRRLEALSRVAESELRSDHIIAVFSAYGDYRSATAMAPPVPSFLYDRERDRLNTLWQRRMAGP